MIDRRSPCGMVLGFACTRSSAVVGMTVDPVIAFHGRTCGVRWLRTSCHRFCVGKPQRRDGGSAGFGGTNSEPRSCTWQLRGNRSLEVHSWLWDVHAWQHGA